MNLKFFHMSLTMRRRRNIILAIQNSQKWICNDTGIRKYFLENFSKLYPSSIPSIPFEFDELGEKVISEFENSLILKVPTPEQVKENVGKLHPFKSPRSYGFSISFFQKFLEDGRGVCGFLCARMLSTKSSSSQPEFLILIPKTKQPTSFNHFRPINLYNFVYKIISRIITNRLKSLMGKVISPHQEAFPSRKMDWG